MLATGAAPPGAVGDPTTLHKVLRGVLQPGNKASACALAQITSGRVGYHLGLAMLCLTQWIKHRWPSTGTVPWFWAIPTAHTQVQAGPDTRTDPSPRPQHPLTCGYHAIHRVLCRMDLSPALQWPILTTDQEVHQIRTLICEILATAAKDSKLVLQTARPTRPTAHSPRQLTRAPPQHTPLKPQAQTPRPPNAAHANCSPPPTPTHMASPMAGAVLSRAQKGETAAPRLTRQPLPTGSACRAARSRLGPLSHVPPTRGPRTCPPSSLPWRRRRPPRPAKAHPPGWQCNPHPPIPPLPSCPHPHRRPPPPPPNPPSPPTSSTKPRPTPKLQLHTKLPESPRPPHRQLRHPSSTPRTPRTQQRCPREVLLNLEPEPNPKPDSKPKPEPKQ